MSFRTRPLIKVEPDPERELARVAVPPVESVCPACNAQVGQPCTAPTDTSRRPVRWFHHARIALAKDGGSP